MKTFKGRVFLFIALITMASGLTWALNAQQKPPQPPKTYSVTLTIEQWQSIFSGLEAIKSTVKLSNMSARESTYISDSLISVYQNEFGRQIQQQLAAEKLKPEVKKDSTIKTKKN